MLGGHFQEQSGHEAAEEIRRREAESQADTDLRQAAMEHHADDGAAARSEGESNADFAAALSSITARVNWKTTRVAWMARTRPKRIPANTLSAAK